MFTFQTVGWSALFYAVSGGYLEMTQLLITAGADILLKDKVYRIIIESVDSISKDERGFPLTKYITNGRISRGGYSFTHFKPHHRVLRLISYSMSV